MIRNELNSESRHWYDKKPRCVDKCVTWIWGLGSYISDKTRRKHRAGSSEIVNYPKQPLKKDRSYIIITPEVSFQFKIHFRELKIG